jgi:hypothetical protein
MAGRLPPMRIALACLAVCSLAVIPGCGDTMSRGIVITGEGKFGANTARTQREILAERLKVAIEDDLGPGWRIGVRVDELPVWIESRSSEDGDWRWERITMAIEIAPTAGGALPEAKRAELEAGARDYLMGKLVKREPGRLALTVTVPAVSAPAQPPVAHNPGERSYVVQAGDTLADISTAFYGSPQHWRAIAAANPGAADGGLQPGVRLVIPALTAPATAPAPAAAP